MRPMLATSLMQTDKLIQLCNDPLWSVQPKLDGVRLMVKLDEQGAVGWGRGGQRATVPPSIIETLKQAEWNEMLIVDGELIKEQNRYRYHIFDLQCPEMVNWGFEERYYRLLTMAHKAGWTKQSPIIAVPRFETSVQKLRAVQSLLELGSEGVVLRKNCGVYTPGRSREVLKYKFTHTADCVITDIGRDGKRNIVLSLWEVAPHLGGLLKEVAAVTSVGADPNLTIGDVVEVTYLGVGAHGRLVQPVKPRLRRDKVSIECTLDQLADFRNRKLASEWPIP